MILTRGLHQIEISAQGGTVVRWQYDENQILFPQQRVALASALKLRGGIPICAPVHGASPERWVEKGLGQHGFVREALFGVIEKDEDQVRMLKLFRGSKAYPWGLNFSAIFSMTPNGFTHAFQLRYNELENHLRHLRLNSEMPVAPGIHPYFATPAGGGWHLFHGDVILHHHELGVGQSLVLDLDTDEKVRLDTALGTVVLEAKPPYSDLVVWTDSTKYVCVEPVAGQGNFDTPEGIFLPPRGVEMNPSGRITLECTFDFEPYEE